ncbi:MAG: lytic transglycosylase domain-containing protein [Clostridium sp.]|nr:lytic transglycosylase domain-containing protein [Clostridium sp.]
MAINNVNLSNEAIAQFLYSIADKTNSNSEMDLAFSEILASAIKDSDSDSNQTTNSNNYIHTATGTVLQDLPLILNGRAYYNKASYNNLNNYTYIPVSNIDTTSIDNLDVSYAKYVDCSNNVDRATMNRIQLAASNAAKKYGVDSNLILAIINHESGYQPNAQNPNSDAQGLMQVLKRYQAAFGITDGFNIEQNIDGGTRILKTCIDTYNGDIGMGLIAYAGGSGVMKSRGVNSFSDLYKMPNEAKKAVPEIIAGYQALKRKNS